ncbi:Na+/H+ antiporter family protein [Pseudomonas benzenivorans]|nr:Na+/H+ antiporter NhaC family protein [Pseudomonas benzenivorans]SDH24185.1 Na+/H+ antiporter family protein [Pseudomonas benzenivorans]
MTAGLLPALVFLAMAALAFATGSSWGIYVVTIPIVMPLANSLDANIPLVIGAMLSASAFGSQACFYSDSTVLAAQGAGCNLISHALTQLPYTLIAQAWPSSASCSLPESGERKNGFWRPVFCGNDER